MWGPIGDDAAAALAQLLAALVAGALIGLERSIHGRPAGFRTHALVCLASAALMLISVYQGSWIGDALPETVRTDPTRMAQGIMTGVGFIGAGVIFKEGLSVRGLTTAASIWITASIGILVGVGFYLPAAASTIAALGVLSAFRWVEMRLPRAVLAHHALKFRNEEAMPERKVRELIEQHGFSIANLSYALLDDGRSFEYRMVIRTRRREDLTRLAWHLRDIPGLVEFQVQPMGD
jgi:putative Mg2+ transporter-C (MgtC) family protein